MNTRFTSLPVLFLVAALGFGLAAGAFAAESKTSAVQERDLDLAACRAWAAGVEKPATLEDVSGSLGLIVPKYPGWAAGLVAKAGEPETFTYRIAMKQPIALGAIYVPRAYQAKLLKSDAPYPGDPTVAAHWTDLTAAGQTGGTTITLPADTQCRALLFTETMNGGRSHLQGVRLFATRLHNVTPDSQPYAAEEYTPPNSDHPTHPASNLVTGYGYLLHAF